MEIGGFVLAGGASRRMGRDKAMILWKSGETRPAQTMLEHTATIVREAVGNVTVLGPSSRYKHFNLPVLEDIVADCGPLGGLYTALQQCERVLLAPVDLPHLTTGFLRRLAAAESRRCVIAKGQPLCGVYHRDALPVVEAAIRERRLRMTELAEALGALEITPEDPLLLQNRNTPDDWSQNI